MGMKFSDDVADGAGRLLEFGRRAESQLGHGVDDSSLHRLEPVADVRQRAIEDDVHRIVEVRLAREDADRRSFHLGDGRRGRREGWLGFTLSRGHQTSSSVAVPERATRMKRDRRRLAAPGDRRSIHNTARVW